MRTGRVTLLRNVNTLPLRPVGFTVLLGGIGALVNYLMLSPLPAPVFYLGGLFYLPVLLRYGLGYALLCAALTQLPLHVSTYVWLPLPELLGLAWLMRRGCAPLRAACWYWASLGLLCAAMISLRMPNWNLHTQLLAMITPSLAGITLMTLSQHTVAAFQRRPDTGRAIADEFSDLLVVFACIPVLCFHVFATPLFLRSQLNDALLDMQHSEQVASERFTLLVERNLRGLMVIAQLLGKNVNTEPVQFEPLLETVRAELPDVFTLILIDREGYAVAGAPARFPDGATVAEAHQYYGDRDYFREAKTSGKAMVSYGIIGRRMNKEPLLSLVAPVLDEQQQFRGVVLGNLPLQRLAPVILAEQRPTRFLAAIYDRKQQILYSSPELQWPVLTPLAELPIHHHDTRQRLPEQIGIGGNLRPFLWQGHLVRRLDNDNGGLLLLLDMRNEIRQLALFSLVTLLLLAALLLAAHNRARHYGNRLLAPLLALHRHVQQLDPATVHNSQPLDIPSSLGEINALVRAINGMMIRGAKAKLETDWAISEKDKLNADLDRRIAERTDELARKASELEQLSITDALTGLSNRRHLTERLHALWSHGQQTALPFALILFDVDHFKSINDRYGHPTGDEVLRQIGKVLKHRIRDGDVAARYGGEEFALLLPGLDAAHAVNLAERVRQTLAETLIAHAGERLRFTVSLGVCDNNDASLGDEHELLQRADQALYHAKRSGRNQTVCWHHELTNSTTTT